MSDGPAVWDRLAALRWRTRPEKLGLPEVLAMGDGDMVSRGSYAVPAF